MDINIIIKEANPNSSNEAKEPIKYKTPNMIFAFFNSETFFS